MTDAPKTQDSLVARARAGDRDAQRQIVEQHQADVFYLALGLLGNRAEAEDIMQDVLFKALQSLGQFRGDSALGTWLYRITVNACRDHQRRRRWQWLPLTALAGHPAQRDTTPSVDPQRHASGAELQRDLLPALDSLSGGERRVFVCRHFQQLSVAETAQVLGLAEGTVKALSSRGLHKLRTLLGAHRAPEVSP